MDFALRPSISCFERPFDFFKRKSSGHDARRMQRSVGDKLDRSCKVRRMIVDQARFNSDRFANQAQRNKTRRGGGSADKQYRASSGSRTNCQFNGRRGAGTFENRRDSLLSPQFGNICIVGNGHCTQLASTIQLNG